MSWEFRKVGPGENVAVEAQTDPFAAPKWAPPVWHMPEWLVLLVNLIRGLAALAVFCVRNIIPLSFTAGLGWIGYRFGWQAPRSAASPGCGRPGGVGGGRPVLVRAVGGAAGLVLVAIGVRLPAALATGPGHGGADQDP